MTSKDTKNHFRAIRNILKKDADTLVLLENLSKQLKVEVGVRSYNSALLWGSETEFANAYPLSNNNINFATLYSSNEQGKLLADLLIILVKKELEKKRIGNEVLGLYREINMIYDFSDLLSEKIDEKSLAEIALREASQIINATHGLFLIYDSDHDKVIELSSFGESPDRERNIEYQNSFLKELILRGTSSIVSPERIQNNPALRHFKAVMYAPLRVKHRTLGLVILGHDKEMEFTAAELKLLTTIALQSAGAIESANLYQKGLREAKEREEAIKSIHEVSQKFVPNEFIKALDKNKLTEVALGDLAEKDVTVMFVDIRGYTALSENLNPKDNFLFINSFNKKWGP